MNDAPQAQTRKPILCLDFDGVLHSYRSGWKGADIVTDEPTPGAISFLIEAIDHFDVQIFSSRSNQPGGIAAMQTWFDFWLDDYVDHARVAGVVDVNPIRESCNRMRRQVTFPMEKPAAMITIDDRALTFQGDWSVFTMERLKAFKPWNKD